MSLADLSPSDAGGRGVFIRKQTANIYTVMLILSFVFVAIGCLFLFLEQKSYDGLSTRVPAEAKVPSPPPEPEPTSAGAGAENAAPDTAAPSTGPDSSAGGATQSSPQSTQTETP